MTRPSMESERASNDPGYGTAGHLSFAPHTELFGIAPEHHYTRLMQLGMETLKRRLEQLDGPSSGIRPEELQKAFSNIDLDHPLENIEQVLAEIDTLYLSHAIYFQHPDYLAHLNCPVMLTSLLAEQLSSAINTAVETWDQSAGGTLIEQKIIDWICERVGFHEFADGVFTTGGTQSNLMALLLAFFAYDLVFMPHGENLILVLDEKVPVTILMKDIGEEIAILNGSASLPKNVAQLAVSLDENMKLNYILLDIFDCIFRFIAPLLDRHTSVSEHTFWALVADKVRAYQTSHPQFADKYHRYDLFQSTFVRTCLNRIQLNNNQQMIDIEDREQNLRFAGDIDNPLHRFAASHSFGVKPT